MECPKCGSSQVERLPPSPVSPKPGYRCNNCGAKMRSSGTLVVYLVVLLLGLVFFGFAVYALLNPADFKQPLSFVGLGIVGLVISGYSAMQIVLPTPRRSGKRSRPWSEENLYNLATSPKELAEFRRETGELLCALGNPRAAGITDADIDRAVAESIEAYTAGRAPYQGGALTGFDRFVTRDRMIRKHEDYLHIHERRTNNDLDCIHLFSLPDSPDGLRWLKVFIDDSQQKAFVLTEHQAMDEPSRIRWWLLREDGVWKIHEFEPVFQEAPKM